MSNTVARAQTSSAVGWWVKDPEPREHVLPYKGGKVKANFIQLRLGVLLQVGLITEWSHPNEKKAKHPPFTDGYGAIWIPNRELEDRTEGATEWMRYDDVNTAYRAQLIISILYGITHERPQTEAASVHGLIDDALTQGPILIGGARPGLPTERIDELSNKRDAHKKRAEVDFRKALKTLQADSLGRRNPGGAARQAGEGIGELKKRVITLKCLDEFVGERGAMFRAMIESSYDIYQTLCEDLFIQSSGRGAKPMSIAFALLQIKRGEEPDTTPLAKEQGSKARFLVRKRLVEHRHALEHIREAPSCRNAWHTGNDLVEAITIALGAPTEKLEEVLERLKNGLNWFYASHYVQFEVAIPLSIQIHLERLTWRDLRSSPATRKSFRFVKFKDYLTDPVVSERFQQIVELYRRFVDKVLPECRDEKLRNPVKKQVQFRVEVSDLSIHNRHWVSFAKQLDVITTIL